MMIQPILAERFTNRSENNNDGILSLYFFDTILSKDYPIS